MTKIEFMCDDSDVIANFPPLPAGKIIPDWYKDMPNTIDIVPGYVEEDNLPTIKRCVPVLDYMTSGYIIRNTYQADVRRYVDNNGMKAFGVDNAKEMYVGAHPWHQARVLIHGDKNHYMKLHQPWLIRTPPGYSSLIYQPHYFFRREYSLFPAIVDTDSHDDAVSLVGKINVDHFMLEPGEPLVVVFPFKREEWKMQITKLEENLAYTNGFRYFLQKRWHGTYAKFFHKKKKYT